MADQTIKNGTAIVFADVAGDFGDSPLAGTDQLTLATLANTAARESDQADLGATRAERWDVTARLELDVAPASGAVIELWWAPSPSAVAATANPGGVTGSDGAYTGTAGDSLADSILQLELIMAFICTSDAATVVQQQTRQFFPAERYGTLVVYNTSGQALEGDDIEMSIIFQPIVGDIT